MTRASWIVVGTDFSNGADLALAYAIELAAASRAMVALVHAYVDVTDESSEDHRDALRARLDHVIATSNAASAGVHVEPLLRRGTPWEKLQNVATDMGATHILIGAHGASTQRSVGGVATSALSSAKRSVLVISHQRPERLDREGT